jgi:tetratricopeptide (TPR) repeat protein
MRNWSVALALTFGLGLPATAQDMIHVEGRWRSGKISGVTSTEVDFTVAGSGEKVPINRIESIVFDGEPQPLRSARQAIDKTSYDEALKDLDRIQVDQIARDEIRREIEYFKVLCAAKSALRGEGNVEDVVKQVEEFLTANAQSMRFFAATELAAEMMAAQGDSARAKEFYQRLAKAPWPDYRMRAAVAAANLLLTDGKKDEAQRLFDNVLAMTATDDASKTQQLAATLGKARCMAESDQAAEALRRIDEVIAKAPNDDADLLARAYTAKGVVLRKSGKLQEALFALLRVDTLYAHGDEDVHAEALYHLMGLWQDLKNPGRAAEAKRTLAEQFRNSRWNRLATKAP